jgi:4-hydroxybenzoyl-CoA reductase subunit beta
MLRMPEFQVALPSSAQEAARLMHDLDDAMFVAGGTDLLPNLKHGLHQPSHLISLSGIPEMNGITLEADGTLHIGASTTLDTIVSSPVVTTSLPGLAVAAASVAGPQHRNMGTIGGNIMLDTRCLYYNQSLPWRKSLGYCLKKDGDWCHVIGSKATCVAAHSADTPPVLLATGAILCFETAEGGVEVSLKDLYQQDGRYLKNHSLDRNTLLTAVKIPPRAVGHRSTYRKVRARDSVDFPQLGIGLAAGFDGGVCTELVAVVSAVMPKPKFLKKMDQAVGTRLDDATINTLAEAAFKQVRPQSSIHGSPAWRRHMAKVEMKRGLIALRDQA